MHLVSIVFTTTLLVLLALAHGQSRSECESGESYWCDSLTNAVECGAVEHCSTMWATFIKAADLSENIITNETPYCELCKRLTSTQHSFLTNAKVQSDLTKGSVYFCGLLTDKSVCDDVVGQCFPDLMFHLIEKFEKPFVNLCQDWDICNEFQNITIQPRHFSFNKQNHQTTHAIPDDEDFLEDLEVCEDSLSGLFESLTDSTFRKQIAKFAKTSQCNRFFDIEQVASCRKSIDKGTVLLVNFINDVDPTATCRSLYNCSGDLAKVNFLLQKLGLGVRLLKLLLESRGKSKNFL